ncbi:hypothetical protein D9758_009360 [Tetrapyrgos nigripes]|uniref:Uncharacterized protein n=1 Tax=Tetrapyrgos nigripes TaxID=182062 RepID=A0A8H5GGZ5_9AGAR|nr:hypothetical protein D9758_009360 [Tetrapyrgos nigripes]
MYRSHKDESSEYVPLAMHQDGDSGEDVDYCLHRLIPVSEPPAITRPSPYVFWTSVLIALLSLVNLILISKTILHYQVSDAALDALPYPDLHVGFNRIEKLLHNTLPRAYIHVWPTHIARINQGLKNAVYGSFYEVFISVKKGPIETRKQDLVTKGDISEIEVWSIISPAVAASASVSCESVGQSDLDNLDFDTMSWNNRPVRGELLGTLDLQSGQGLLNATTEKFACPRRNKHLVVELRCIRVDCQVSFSRIMDVHPSMGFELLRQVP